MLHVLSELSLPDLAASAISYDDIPYRWGPMDDFPGEGCLKLSTQHLEWRHTGHQLSPVLSLKHRHPSPGKPDCLVPQDLRVQCLV